MISSALKGATVQRITGGAVMPKGEQRGNREPKKPKKEKQKTIAAAPLMKGSGPQRRTEEVGGLPAPEKAS